MFLMKVYHLLISPLLHLICGPFYGCRYTPTCSQYMEGAIQEHGWVKGSLFGIKRVLRCHPFSKSEPFDPIPRRATRL